MLIKMKSKIKVLQLHDLFYASLPINLKLWQLLLNFSQCTAYTVTLMARRQVADLVIKMFLSTKSAISLHETNVRLICKRLRRGGDHRDWVSCARTGVEATPNVAC